MGVLQIYWINVQSFSARQTNRVFGHILHCPAPAKPRLRWLSITRRGSGGQRIDLTQVLVTHPQATYFMRASGHSMVEAGIFDNDIIVVDRAIKPRHNHVVVAIVDGDFTVKHL